MIGLFEESDIQESRFDDKGYLEDIVVAATWLAAVPGRVGGFIPRGACGLNGGDLDGCGALGLCGFAVGLGGSGLLGGSDGLYKGAEGFGLNNAGGGGKSFAGGVGGTVMFGPLRISPMFSSSPGGIPTLNSFSGSPPVPTKSIIATGDTSTHRGDVIWETNGICRAQQTRRRSVEASMREARGRDEGMYQH